MLNSSETLLIGTARDQNRLVRELHYLGIPAEAHPGHDYWFRVRSSSLFESDRWRPLSYASQILPNAETLMSSSISTLAHEAASRLFDLPDLGQPWRLDVFGGEGRSGDPHTRRSSLVHEAILKELTRIQRERLTSLQAADSLHPPTQRVQIAIGDSGPSYLSVVPLPARSNLGGVLSHCSGGYTLPAEDRRPPSRAYQKLLEGLAHLDLRICSGESCVDLGACPGGWTYVAAANGARVLAVDRTALDPALMKNPKVRFERGDGFKFRPSTPVDWLLCDMIAYPERTREMMQTWIGEGLCRRFFVTMKFKGEPDFVSLHGAVSDLLPLCEVLSVRHLLSNKNEVMFGGVVMSERIKRDDTSAP